MKPIDLTQYDDVWSHTQAAPDVTDKLPDGAYTMTVERVEITETKNSRPCVLWTLKIVGPRLAGRRHWHRDFLDKPESYAYLKKNFALFGIVVAKLSEAPAHFASMAGKTLEVVLKTSGRFQATHLNRLVTAPAAGAGSGNPDAGGPGIAGLSPF